MRLPKTPKIISSNFEDGSYKNEDNYKIIINCSILKGIIDFIAVCPFCTEPKFNFEKMEANRMGFSCKLKFVQYFKTSQEYSQLEKLASGRRLSEMNVRSVIAFQEIGREYKAMANFSRCKNMPCLTDKAFSYIQNSLYYVCEDVAIASMKNAATETECK